MAPVLERGVGSLVVACGGQEVQGRGEELVDGTDERRERLLSDMQGLSMILSCGGTLGDIVHLPPVVFYLFYVLSFSLGRFLPDLPSL